MTTSARPTHPHRPRPGRPSLAAALGAAALLAGCGTSPSPGTPGTPGTQAEAVTFHRDLEPVLQQRCQGCHSPGRIAPFSLVTYADARAVAPLMALQTGAQAMPPWGARGTSDCQPRFPWKDDHRLTAAQIKLFADWSLAGAPEGDPADAPPPYSPPPDGLPGVQQTVQPVQPFTTAGNDDQFQCFVIDPGFQSARYLNGWHFIAGSPRVVHHALLFAASDAGAAAQARTKGGRAGTYPCFGGPEVSASLVGAWAPGGVPTELPSNVATTMAAGTVFVMQIHYHPAGSTAQLDSTSVQLRFLPSPPEWQLLTTLIGNLGSYDPQTGDGLQPDEQGKVEFRIPANAASKVIDQVVTVPQTIFGFPLPELRLLQIGTHMHYVGRDMRIEIQRGETVAAGDPKSECLIDTPEWNFNWQRAYQYDVPIDQLPRVHGGDKLRLRCRYDNTMQNPFVVTALAQQHLASPRDVVLGETTLDEMCLGVFGALLKQ